MKPRPTPADSQIIANLLILLPIAVLSIAAASKFRSLDSQIPLLKLELAELLAFVVLPTFELCLALGLIFARKLAVPVAFFTLSSFAGFLYGRHWVGEYQCNCFGSQVIDSRIALATDFIMLAIVCFQKQCESIWGTTFGKLASAFAFPVVAVVSAVCPSISSALDLSLAPSAFVVETQIDRQLFVDTHFATKACITNRGLKTLAVEHVVPSCACTSVKPMRFTLEPNGALCLDLTIDLEKGYSNDQFAQHHRIEAVLYDKQMVQIGKVLLFSADSNRTFQILPKRTLLHISEKGAESIAIPLRWLQRPSDDTPLICRNDFKEVVAITQYPDVPFLSAPVTHSMFQEFQFEFSIERAESKYERTKFIVAVAQSPPRTSITKCVFDSSTNAGAIEFDTERLAIVESYQMDGALETQNACLEENRLVIGAKLEANRTAYHKLAFEDNQLQHWLIVPHLIRSNPLTEVPRVN